LSSTRIKVLFVLTDLSGGGAERVALTVLRSLDRERVEPSLFLLRRAGVYWDEVRQDMRVSWAVGGSGALKHRALGILRKLSAEVAKNDVIVGALELLPSYFACIAGKFERKPVIAWVHTDLEQHLPLLGRVWMQRQMIKAIYPRFRTIVFPSEAGRDAFVRMLPVTLPKTQVIYNPIDSAMVESKAVKAGPGWADAVFAKPTIIAVGRLKMAHKGFDLLLRAHAELVCSGVDHNLLILGEGPDRGLLETTARELGVSESFFLPGFEENPYRLMRRARALVLPSRFEAFGMVALEAMALGVPVICLRSAKGPVEILDGGKFGICVPSDDPKALTSAVSELLSDAALRDRYACLGKKRVASFQTEDIARQWKALIWSAVPSNTR
jgi:glycosyltransferase involved in cell wall biosynthesis